MIRKKFETKLLQQNFLAFSKNRVVKKLWWRGGVHLGNATRGGCNGSDLWLIGVHVRRVRRKRATMSASMSPSN